MTPLARRAFLRQLGTVVVVGGQPRPEPGCSDTQILVREDASVEVIAHRMAKDQLAGLLDAAMIPATQRGALSTVLARAPALTVTFTSKRCRP